MNDQHSFNSTTHFGYKKVPVDEKADHVAQVFHSVADRYDIMNDLMSMGIHRIWKRLTLEMSAVRSGQQVLDIAAGTGDLALRFARLVGSEGHVVVADINDSMLKVGRNKLINHGIINNVDYIQANAECLPFSENTFDCITIGFGLRNVTDKDKALASMLRCLKPGGCLLILEFSKTNNPLLTKFYDLYSFKILPHMGKWVVDDPDSYRYLAESIRMHPDQETLKGMMEAVGFVNCRYHNMSGGIVAVHYGTKP